MSSPKQSYDAFSSVDKMVAKPVFGSDGAASWQEFRKETKELQRESVAPSLQVKRADRLGTGFQTLREERLHENEIRKKSGEAELGSGYTEFKRKHDPEEAAARKKRKLIEERVRPKEKKYYIASPTFDGYKFDYIFTTRDYGTGYYWDGMDSLKKLKAADDGQDLDDGAQEEAGNNDAENTISDSSNIPKRKKKGKKKPKAPTMINDPNNPLEQVASAIQRRLNNLHVPPTALTGLPAGWNKAADPSSGKTYYFNKSTGERQWDPPSETNNNQNNPAAAPAPASSNSNSPNNSLPEGWNVANDPTSGKTYYYHSNGETRWEKPS